MGDVADCTAIELNIENITGVTDADDNFIRSAQKFVVASIPKNLLLFASKQSSTYTGGGGVAANIDSIVEVQRNGYSCKQIPISESKWAADSTSLKYATSKHPVWWFDSNVIKILPEPSGSEDGYYYYIDYTEINDDSDLRNAVVYHACASEFTKIAVYSAPTVGGDADELTDITALDAENTIDDFDGNSIEVDQWFATAAHLIEGEEDIELAQAQLGKISTYINAYGAELQKVNAKAAHNLQMADKYYQWANLEVRQYVENNSKTDIRRAATNQVATAGR